MEFDAAPFYVEGVVLVVGGEHEVEEVILVIDVRMRGFHWCL